MWKHCKQKQLSIFTLQDPRSWINIITYCLVQFLMLCVIKKNTYSNNKNCMFAEMVKKTSQLQKQNQKYCLIFESSAVFYSKIQSTHLEKHIFNRLQRGKDTTFIFIYKKCQSSWLMVCLCGQSHCLKQWKLYYKV